MYKVRHSPIVLEPRFSWVPTGFPPAFLVVFPPDIHSKTVHWATRVTSNAQLKSHAQCLSQLWLHSVLGGSEQMQYEGLFLAKYGCCGCCKSYVHEKLDLYMARWFWRELLGQQQPLGSNLAFWRAPCQSALCQHRRWCWLCIQVGACTFEHLVSISNKLQLFFRILQWFC